MKAIVVSLIVLFGVFILLALVLPGMSLHTGILITRHGVERMDALRLEAAKGDISQAASALKSVVEFSSSKIPREGDLACILETSRAGVIREIISRMRSLSGEDLGDDPKPWIEKYHHKIGPQANKRIGGS